jgi:pimeloyl-ACP methyl ester carboxylesterase
MAGFLARPSERSYNRFMRQCSFDLDGLRDQMGERWDAFVDYNIDLARSPKAKAAGRLMRKVGLPRIPAAELERIAVPTTLIWGRQDRAIRLRIAEAASARFGWRLRVIEDCADDPPRDRPAEFLSALRPALPS